MGPASCTTPSGRRSSFGARPARARRRHPLERGTRLAPAALRAVGRDADVCFRFTSGDPAPWPRWRAGDRPQVNGSKVRWRHAAAADGGDQSFASYLESVYTYAGTLSLAKELEPVADPNTLAL